MKRHAVMLLALVYLAGCYDSAFVRNDGPISAHGVKVSLVGQRCSFAESMNGAANGGLANQLDLGVRVAIQNDTKDTLTVEPGNVRLLVGTELDAPVQSSKSVTVAPGATTSVDVRFKHRGDLGCNSNLALTLKKAVIDGGQAIELDQVGFVPGANDT